MRNVAVLAVLLGGTASALAQAPTDDPLARYHLDWTGTIAWGNVVSMADVPGADADARLAKAQEKLAGKGGVIFFPAGTYVFKDSIVLNDGVVLRGAAPKHTDARKDDFDLPTRFEFPKYVPSFEGNGTPINTAFKAITVADPATTSNCGLVHLHIERGHVHFGDGTEHKAASTEVPSAKHEQHPWQRFTQRHQAAIEICTSENALVAGNRLPESGEDNFLQKGYILQDPKKKKFVVEEGVVFDYDNRPGIYVNSYGIGAGGGNGPAGTPASHPHGFRKGIVIKDNYIFATGRCAIAFSGDGTICSFNVIRFKPGIKRWTTTGLVGVTGTGTNDNRAVQMRGYRWTVEGNDYIVHRNQAAFGGYPINDGEGLMHEAHVNSAIVDSRLIGNKGNSYLSLYKAHGIDGLVIKNNVISQDGGKIDAIYVSSNYNGRRFPIKNVLIENNTTTRTGILLDGGPAENIVVRNNRHDGPGGIIRVFVEAAFENNKGYNVVRK
jgi:hypothetical protein